MKTSFLDYYKLILEKVSFDSHLFNKEYQKAIRTLKSREAELLDSWLRDKGLHSSLTRMSRNDFLFANGLKKEAIRGFPNRQKA